VPNDPNPSRAKPTRSDVATLANVSGATVSRVLGGRADESISAKARARVLQAARELGYTPNSAAKALRSGRTGLIGFWINLEYSPYRYQVLAEMRRLLARTEFAMAVTDVDEDYAWHHSLDRALRVPVEGVIAFDASTAAHIFAQNSDRLAPNLPFVSMGAFYAESKSFVGVDLKSGAEDAMDHLFATGRRKIAYVAPDGYFLTDGDRFAGYRNKMLAFGLELRMLGIEDVQETRVESIKAVLAANPDVDSLLCFYDDIALDAVDALISLGRQPGVDVAIVGFNGQPGIERGICPLSSVRQPVEAMCALALEMLQEQIENPATPVRHQFLKPELIVRASSGHRQA